MTGFDDRRRSPNSSRLLGYGPALLLLLLSLGTWVEEPRTGSWLIALGQLWAAAILLFLAGVQRGLSFASPRGARLSQIAPAIVVFGLGLAGLMLPLALSLVALTAGYAAVGMIDWIAARNGDAPAHFARLRPVQAGLFLIGLAGLLGWAITHGI